MASNIPDKMKAAALDRFGGPEVVAVGKNVKRFKEGDRVYGAAMGSSKGGFYAEYAAIKETDAARVPKGMKMEEAGALAADGITALVGLEEKLKLGQGQKLIIFGANGGVGHIALQLANRLGAKVLAIASGEDGVKLTKRLGADEAVEGHDAAQVDKACSEFAPDGADAALVLACGEACRKALQHVKKGGRIAYPNGVEPEPSAPEGVELISYDGDASVEKYERLNELIESGPFHLNIDKVYALEEAAKAQEEVLKHHLGKLALKIH